MIDIWYFLFIMLYNFDYCLIKFLESMWLIKELLINLYIFIWIVIFYFKLLLRLVLIIVKFSFVKNEYNF